MFCESRTLKLIACSFLTWICLGAVFVVGVDAHSINSLTTSSGVVFSVWDEQPSLPAPTVIILSDTATLSLTNPDFIQSGAILADNGFVCVSLNVPGYNAFGAGDTGGLDKWREYSDAETDFVANFNEQVSDVLDYLIESNYTNSTQVAAIGTSKGGFLALQYMATDPRIQVGAVFAPVTDLARLTEFTGAEQDPFVQNLALSNLANDLAGRPIWISIGGDDPRVGTDAAEGFAAAVETAAQAGNLANLLELHLDPEVTTHITPPGSAEAAAEWILFNINYAAAPEPSSAALLSTSLLIFVPLMSRRRACRLRK